MVLLSACTTSPVDLPSADIVSAKIELDGTTLSTLAVDATLNGDFLDGSPAWTSEYSDTLQDTKVFDTLALSTGDQVWHDGVVIHLVDTRTEAPAALVERCGLEVGLTLALGAGDPVDGHVESTQGTTRVTITCR